MARKKQRKKSWLRTLVLFLLIPVAVWSIAFLLWFYWYDLSSLFSREGRVSPKPPRQIGKDDRRERLPAPQPQEKIFEEDRKQLEDVLKRRN